MLNWTGPAYFVAATLLIITSCGGTARQAEGTTVDVVRDEADELPDEADEFQADAEPEFLPTPYTAEAIRAEWVTGLTLVLRRQSAQEESRQRWTVVASDAEGVTIEFATIDEAGEVVGEAEANRTTWTELRDHARFPAAHGRREETQRTTPLGELEGWLYTVEDPDTGAVSTFFFAHDLPGAPVWVQTVRGDDLLDELEQLERRRPE